MENTQKPNCSKCEFMFKNNQWAKIKTKKGMTQPGKRYCQHPAVKNKVISYRALGKYTYPIWCPLNTYKGTCIECGTLIREDDGDYCNKHRGK